MARLSSLSDPECLKRCLINSIALDTSTESLLGTAPKLNYATDPHKKRREVLQSWEDSEMLFDAIRYKNPDHIEYTLGVWNSKIASRIDMIWARGNLLDHMEVKNCIKKESPWFQMPKKSGIGTI